MTLSRGEIQKCVNNEEWQLFRQTLKGLPTHTKLQMLKDYLWEGTLSDDVEEMRKRRVRVENYLNALRRGGELIHFDVEEGI